MNKLAQIWILLDFLLSYLSILLVLIFYIHVVPFYLAFNYDYLQKTHMET
jgi:hypothetical protein